MAPLSDPGVPRPKVRGRCVQNLSLKVDSLRRTELVSRWKVALDYHFSTAADHLST
jgi:hypothetical protein